jgi:hypothetical protein
MSERKEAVIDLKFLAGGKEWSLFRTISSRSVIDGSILDARSDQEIPFSWWQRARGNWPICCVERVPVIKALQ